jgi:polyphosphate glucokinase
MTPEEMVSRVQRSVRDWNYDVISVGYPGPARNGLPIAEPPNLGPGWVGFDFETAFKRPVKLLNDAAMQALGSYRGGTMLFLGLGTGLGSALIANGTLLPLEMGHLPYRNKTFEHYVGVRGLKRSGLEQWRLDVADVVSRLAAALQPDDVVLGGGNVNNLEDLPARTRAGHNANAFRGGFRLWEYVTPATSNNFRVRRERAHVIPKGLSNSTR